MKAACLVLVGLALGFARPAAAKSTRRWPPDRRSRAEGKACLARLDDLGVKWKKAPSVARVVTPIYVPGMEIAGVKLTPIWRKGPFVMDCHLALAFADQGARILRTAGVVELRFAGIHEYRRVNDEKTGPLSPHAYGVAIDVYEMVTADGVKHVVKDDYPDGDLTLLGVERAVSGSDGFRMLLTPGNDPDHHSDHFHFEASAGR